MQNQREIKFICDHMLGRLARWLRIIGFDTLYPEVGPDSELIENASNTGRMILTRDKVVAGTKKAEAIYISSDILDEQLAQVAIELELTFDGDIRENEDGSLLNRCGLCNGVLNPLPKEKAGSLVPDGVREHIEVYWQCNGCKKVYWEGTHWDQIKERIERVRGLVGSR